MRQRVPHQGLREPLSMQENPSLFVSESSAEVSYSWSHMFAIDEVNVPNALSLPVGEDRQPGHSIQSPHPSAKQKKLRFTNVKTLYVYALARNSL